MITHERLTDVLHYDPITGAFTWRVRLARCVRVGDRAGCLHKTKGYRWITIDKIAYQEHRLAAFYMTGRWPALEADHNNTNKADNRWDNLRPASRSDNACNRGAPANNTSGFKGVSFDKRLRKWRAIIMRYGVSRELGRFATPQAAAAAYERAAAELHGAFARLA